jgi:translocation and assembly module TamB
VLDPVLTAQGEQVRGQLTVDAGIAGTMHAPRIHGTARLANGEAQAYALGARISDIQALIQVNGDTIRIERFTGRAGQGTISISGTAGVAPPMPVDIRLAANNATPLASDKLTALLNANLSLRGQLQGPLDAAGDIPIVRADIRIPETMPVKVATLDVVRPGQKPLPPPAPPPDINLNLNIDSPGQIWVRGRGLEAELAGHLHIGGTAAAPKPEGGFTLRRGTFNVVGTTLTFTSGKVSFDGSGKIDPTLDFVASSTSSNITANLNITGYASAPKITLSSNPDAPQDEILARLLFNQSAGSLSAFQYASIAAALAQMSGVGGGSSPLDTLRQDLGLDRLSVGGGQNNSGPQVRAGRYVAPGIYVGAKQSTSGSTQAQVQIDLAKGLKFQAGTGPSNANAAATAGSTAAQDSSGTNVGLTYQFEY